MTDKPRIGRPTTRLHDGAANGHDAGQLTTQRGGMMSKNIWKRYLDETHWSFVGDEEILKLARISDNPHGLWLELHSNKRLRTDVAEYVVAEQCPPPEKRISLL